MGVTPMAENDEMEITPEEIPADAQGRIRESLKKALQDQLQKEAKTLGPLGGASGGAIHGKSGVSVGK
jgi:hypothetical protein